MAGEEQYDTVLHTAPLASGNSGSPLVDACDRVLGVNSFGSLWDANDGMEEERSTKYEYYADRPDIVGWTTRDGGQYWVNPMLRN